MRQEQHYIGRNGRLITRLTIQQLMLVALLLHLFIADSNIWLDCWSSIIFIRITGEVNGTLEALIKAKGSSKGEDNPETGRLYSFAEGNTYTKFCKCACWCPN